MRLFRPSWHLLTVLIGSGALTVFWCAGAAPARAQQNDAVENLRQLLKSPVPPPPTPQAVLQSREEKLLEAAKALKSTSDLRLALALSEWRDNPKGGNVPLAKVDQNVRTEIGKRFAAIVQDMVAKGGPTGREAVAKLVGEIGASIRALDPEDKNGFGRSLAPSLLALMEREDDSPARQAAARALGKINPVPDKAAAGLAKLLPSDRKVGERRAASDALGDMVATIYQLQKKGRVETGVEATKEDMIRCATEVVPVLGPALQDSDALVRRNGLNALVQVANALNQYVPDPVDPDKMPPPNRPWTKEEQEDVDRENAQLAQERAFLGPLLAGLKGQGDNIAGNLADSNVEAALAARRVLELLGTARLKLARREAGVPKPFGAPKEQVKASDPLYDAVQPSLNAISKQFLSHDYRVRRATIEFLETLEEDAVPALNTLLAAMVDKDLFIRWRATRTLGKMGLERLNAADKDRTVRAIGRLLNPREDSDLRAVAANTLRTFGPEAKAAVPCLIDMLNVGEAESQEAVIQALSAIGITDSPGAIKGLTTSLASRSANVRRLACEALGRIGPAAQSAVDALRGLMQDEDPTVRLAANEALVSILQPKE